MALVRTADVELEIVRTLQVEVEPTETMATETETLQVLKRETDQLVEVVPVVLRKVAAQVLMAVAAHVEALVVRRAVRMRIVTVIRQILKASVLTIA